MLKFVSYAIIKFQSHYTHGTYHWFNLPRGLVGWFFKKETLVKQTRLVMFCSVTIQKHPARCRPYHLLNSRNKPFSLFRRQTIISYVTHVLLQLYLSAAGWFSSVAKLLGCNRELPVLQQQKNKNLLFTLWFQDNNDSKAIRQARFYVYAVINLPERQLLTFSGI